MSLWVNRWICEQTIFIGHNTTTIRSSRPSRISSMWQKLNITYKHCAFCNAMQWSAVRRKCAKSQSRVQLHHLFVLSTNLFPWIFIYMLFLFFFSCLGYLYLCHTFSLCVCVLFGVHFQFFRGSPFTFNQIKGKQRLHKATFATSNENRMNKSAQRNDNGSNRKSENGRKTAGFTTFHFQPS